jgi:hypothetical protein
LKNPARKDIAMLNDLHPDELWLMRQDAERLALQLRRDAMHAFPGAALQWLAGGLNRAVRAVRRHALKGLRYRTRPTLTRS